MTLRPKRRWHRSKACTPQPVNADNTGFCSLHLIKYNGTADAGQAATAQPEAILQNPALAGFFFGGCAATVSGVAALKAA